MTEKIYETASQLFEILVKSKDRVNLSVNERNFLLKSIYGLNDCIKSSELIDVSRIETIIGLIKNGSSSHMGDVKYTNSEKQSYYRQLYNACCVVQESIDNQRT